MKKISYALVVPLYFSLMACSPVNSIHPFDDEEAAILIKSNMVAKPTQQMVVLQFPRGEHWKKLPDPLGTGSMVVLFPQNENPAAWNEKIQTKISGFIYKPNLTVKTFAQMEMDQAEKNCFHVNDAIITQTPQSMFYRVDVSDCENNKNQTQFGKIFKGIDAIYLVRYSAIMGKVSKTQMMAMSQTIKNAELVKNPHYQAKK